MSTYPIPAAELAAIHRYLADPSVVDLLARGAAANRAACLADGWSDKEIDLNLDGAPVTAATVLASAPVCEPTRKAAAQAIRTLVYNCNNKLSREDGDALDDLFLRVMDGVVWGRYRTPTTPQGPDGTLVDHLRRADAIRAARAAGAAE